MVRNTFYGLNIGASGLFAAQQGIELTGHNISNANTEGYTRQRIVQAAVDPYFGNSFYAPVSKAITGRGVDVLYIDQIRDQFLDRQYRRESSTTSEWASKADALYFVEDIFNGVGSTGIDVGLKNLLSALQELSKNPETKAVRTNLKQEALKLTETIQHNYKQLIDYQSEQNLTVETHVGRVNAIAESIKDLNERIYKFEMSGAHANDLRDKRNLLVDELATLVDIEYHSTQDVNGWEKFHINITNGSGADIPLVSHNKTTELFVKSTKQNTIDGETNMFYEIYYNDGTNDVKLDMTDHTGKIKAHMDMRDGLGTGDEFKGIPYYIEELNKFADALITAFNNIHLNGYTFPDDSNGNASVQGKKFFECTTVAVDNSDPTNPIYSVGSIDPPAAKNITLSKDILDSVYNIAASTEKVTIPTSPDVQTGNSLNVEALINMMNSKSVGLGNASFDDFYQSFVAEMGTEASYANTRYEGQGVLMVSLENQRLSISGVSIDEEMTMLIKYQHSYSASARVITTVDEMLDIMINRMGLVGR